MAVDRRQRDRYFCGPNYGYSWGVGVESQISRFNGNLIYAGETLVDGHSKHNRVDVVAAYNLVRNPDLSTAVTWTPSLVGKTHPTQALPGVVLHAAGPFRE